MATRLLRTGRWLAGVGAFAAAATMLFETAGQSSSLPSPVRPNTYRSVPIDDRDVKTAVTFAIADQKKKNRSNTAVTLTRVLQAEHQSSNGDNFRVCLALDRRGRADTARAVVRRNQKQQWSVALWAWGACGKK